MEAYLSRVKPVWVLWVGILLYAVRWAFIANGHDYGWDYETGYRVFKGGIYGKDFYTSLGPLSYELIGAIFKLFGANWIYTYLIAYGCWLLTLCGVYQLLKNLASEPLVLALSMLIVTPLGIPHMVALHNYNFLSYMLAVWNGVLFFQFLKTEQYRFLVVSGVMVSLSLFAKQNIGLGSVLLTFLLLAFNSFLGVERPLKKLILSSLAFGGSALCASTLLFYKFSRDIGVSELWKLMFVDAAEAKGNAANMIKTAIPRMSFGISSEHNLTWLLQHLAEAFFFGLAIGLNVLLFRHLIFKTKNKKNEESINYSNRDFLKILVLFVFITLIPIVFPSTAFSLRERFYWFDTNLKISRFILAFLSWLSLIGGLFYFFALFNLRKPFWPEHSKKVLLFIYSLGLCFFVCTSSIGYMFLSLPLFLAFFFVSTLSLGLWSRNKIVGVSLILWVGAYIYYPTYALSPMVHLDDSHSRGLWFSEKDRESVELYTKGLRPYVSGKRTLWLSQGGPHSLSGSIPVRNISNLCYDQFNTRIEESLVREWMRNPPEMIVSHWYSYPGNLRWLKSEMFESWIKNNYVQVAEIQGRKVLKYRF